MSKVELLSPIRMNWPSPPVGVAAWGQVPVLMKRFSETAYWLAGPRKGPKLSTRHSRLLTTTIAPCPGEAGSDQDNLR